MITLYIIISSFIIIYQIWHIFFLNEKILLLRDMVSKTQENCDAVFKIAQRIVTSPRFDDKVKRLRGKDGKFLPGKPRKMAFKYGELL